MSNWPQFETTRGRIGQGLFGVLIGTLGLAAAAGGIWLGAEGVQGLIESGIDGESAWPVENSLAALVGGLFIAYHASNLASYGLYNITGSAIANNQRHALGPTLITKRKI